MANIFKYTDAVGPAWVDGTTGFTATFNLQSLAAGRTYAFPDAAGTIALIGNTGTVTTGVWNGTIIDLAYGGTGADLSATGGTSQVVQQSSVGAVLTVGQLALADLSDAATVALLAAPVFTGDVNVSTGNALVSTAGKGVRVKEGSNAKQGVATLVLGTVVVANTSVTANSRIFLTVQSLGTVTVPSALAVSARTASTSFTILASDLTDTSVVAYEIFEPA